MVNVYVVRVQSVKGFVFEGQYSTLPTREDVQGDIRARATDNKTDFQDIVELARPWPRILIVPFMAIARDENWRRIGTVGFNIISRPVKK